MAQTVFKSFKDLQSYLIEEDMIALEEITDTILQGNEAEERGVENETD